jgi:rubrerythrin
MPLDQLILLYVVVMLAGLAGVAIYAELRRRRFEPPPSEDNIFRCRKCGHVYTDDPDMDRSRCAQCGHMNDVFKF